MAKKSKKSQRAKYQNYTKNILSGIESTGNSVSEYEELDKDTQAKIKKEAYYGSGPNPSPSELAARIRHVENMKLSGFTKREITYYCKHNWGVSQTNAIHYYKEAIKNFGQDFREDFESEIDYHLEIRWKLYKDSMKFGKIDVAHKVLKDITTIEGIYEYKPAIVSQGTEFDEVDDYVEEKEKEIEDIRNEKDSDEV